MRYARVARLGRRMRAHISAETLEPRTLLSAYLVKDINPATSGSNPDLFVASGDEVAFRTGAPAGPDSFWLTDGTSAGTHQVPRSLSPESDISFQGAAYVFTSSGLWKVVPGADPLLIYDGDFNTLNGPGLRFADNKLYFVAYDSSGEQLWASDGTSAGTTKLTNVTGGNPNITIEGVAGGRLYFVQTSQTDGLELWSTDGTAAGTRMVFGGFQNEMDFAAKPDGSYYLLAQWGQSAGLYTGTADGLSLVTPLTRNPYLGTNVLVVLGNVAYFTAFDNNNGIELWKSDPNGTTGLVGNLRGGIPGTLPPFSSATPLNGRLLFNFYDRTNPERSDLWSTDGTDAGTYLLHNFYISNFSQPLTPLTVLGKAVYFAADDGVHGTQLWRSDGTPQGTQTVTSINPIGSSSVANITNVGGELYFAADDGTHGSEPWKSDGTAAGTQLVADVNQAPFSSSPRQLADVNGKLYFEADDAAGTQLWSSDGTTAGTTRITSLGPDAPVYAPTAFQGSVYFGSGHAIWKTSGAPGDATKIANLPGYASDFFPVGNVLYFIANATGTTNQPVLWRTDGTAGGTRQITTGPVYPHFINLNGTLVFEASVGQRLQLWRSDGTAAAPFTNIPITSAQSGSISYLDEMLAGATVVANNLYFFDEQTVIVQTRPGVIGGQSYGDLYKTDGTTTTHLALANNAFGELRFLNGQLLSLGGFGVNAFDPAAGNFVSLSQTSANGSVIVGNKIYFAHGHALWVTDGTASGTHLVSDTDPGAPDTTSTLSNLLALDGMVFFDQDAGNARARPWLSDGTAAGTVEVANVNLYAPTSDPFGPVVSGSRIYFAAADGIHGTELWAVDLNGSVMGTVFDDQNHDGTQQAGEPGLAGVTVFADANNDGALDPGEVSTVTDATGTYVLPDLPAGDYIIRQVAPAGYRLTAPLLAAGSVPVSSLRTASGPTFGDVQIGTVPMDFSYLLTLAQHYGQQGTFATGDLNADDQVNFNDLLILAQNYGHALPSVAAVSAADDAALLPVRRSMSGRRGLPKFQTTSRVGK